MPRVKILFILSFPSSKVTFWDRNGIASLQEALWRVEIPQTTTYKDIKLLWSQLSWTLLPVVIKFLKNLTTNLSTCSQYLYASSFPSTHGSFTISTSLNNLFLAATTVPYIHPTMDNLRKKMEIGLTRLTSSAWYIFFDAICFSINLLPHNRCYLLLPSSKIKKGASFPNRHVTAHQFLDFLKPWVPKLNLSHWIFITWMGDMWHFNWPPLYPFQL